MIRLFAVWPLLLVCACSTQEIRMTEPIKPAGASRDLIPVYMGVVIPDETANFTLRGTGPGRTGATGGGVELFLGQAVRENIEAYLESIFRDVAVSNSLETLPAEVTDFAIIRFAPGNELYMPFSVFTETKIIVALELEALGGDRVPAWEIEAGGVSMGKHPPLVDLSFGRDPAASLSKLLDPEYPVSDYFYKTMTDQALRAAFQDLVARIRSRSDTWVKE